jgi:Haem degrading protein HbpS-like
MEVALVARDPEYWLRDSWSVVKLTSGWMMPSASRVIIPLGKPSLQPGLEFRADKFVTNDLQRSSVHRVIRSGAPVVRRPGGLRIKRGGEVEGAIGVCSAPTDEQDEECARCGLEALGLSAEKLRDSGSLR